jgi:hypothetical protein
MHIVIKNLGKRVSDADLAAAVRACGVQLSRHLCPAWVAYPVPVVMAPRGASVGRDARVISIVDVPEDMEALGWHTEDAEDRPSGVVFAGLILDLGGGVLDTKGAGISVSSVLSHEVLELFVDPAVNLWAQGPRIPEGSEYALEVCDPVQGDYYHIPTSRGPVAVSSFVFPSWFDEGERGPYDVLRRLSRNFSMTPSGYMIVREGPGSETAVFASKFDARLLRAKAFARTKERGTKTSPPAEGRKPHASESRPKTSPPARNLIIAPIRAGEGAVLAARRAIRVTRARSALPGRAPARATAPVGARIVPEKVPMPEVEAQKPTPIGGEPPPPPAPKAEMRKAEKAEKASKPEKRPRKK